MSNADSRAAAAAAPSESAAAHPERVGGLGKVLVAVYIVLAIAATARSIYQIATKFDEAPIAYSLSAVAGVVYIVAAVALIKGRSSNSGVWRAVAWGALSFELAGVLIVGVLSITVPELFAHPSVWSHFGSGYVFIPLVLPVLGILWLRRSGRGRAPAAENGAQA